MTAFLAIAMMLQTAADSDIDADVDDGDDDTGSAGGATGGAEGAERVLMAKPEGMPEAHTRRQRGSHRMVLGPRHMHVLRAAWQI